MAPHARGRAILSKKARPRFERLGRRLNSKSKRSGESLQLGAAQ
jgi:hypothetical protein